MRRRAIIQSKPVRRSLVVLGVLVLAAALLGCSMRIARLWQVADGTGGVAAHSLVLMYGTLRWEKEEFPSVGAVLPAPILNWQIEPGLELTTYSSERRTFVGPLGANVSRARTIAFSMPLALLGTVCLIVALPWLPRRPGLCDCGHDLTGLRSDRCPECGTPLADNRR